MKNEKLLIIIELTKKAESALSKLIHEAKEGRATNNLLRAYGITSRELYEYYQGCINE